MTDSSPSTHISLDALRLEIDRVDEMLLQLIEERLAISDAVAAIKRSEPSSLLKLRPRRESFVVERLIARARRADPHLVSHVWRELMSYGLQAQQRTEFVLFGSDRARALEDRVKARFGRVSPLRWAASREEALAAAKDGEAVAVLALENGERDAYLPDGLRAFDIVRGEDDAALALAIGRVSADEALDACPASPEPVASGAMVEERER